MSETFLFCSRCPKLRSKPGLQQLKKPFPALHWMNTWINVWTKEWISNQTVPGFSVTVLGSSWRLSKAFPILSRSVLHPGISRYHCVKQEGGTWCFWIFKGLKSFSSVNIFWGSRWRMCATKWEYIYVYVCTLDGGMILRTEGSQFKRKSREISRWSWNEF